MTAILDQLLENFLKMAAEDTPTVPIPETTNREVAGLPPPPNLPGHSDINKGAHWMAEKILNSHLFKKLEYNGQLLPNEVEELRQILHSRPKK